MLADLSKDNSIEGLSRQENISALLDGIKEFIESDEELIDLPGSQDKSISTYLQSVALITDFDDQDEDKDRLLLMSAHASKGLEFKSVFVVGLEEDLFPSFMAKDTPASMDEERRLFYVAITRAMEQLTLSFSESRYQYGSMRYNDPSRFLSEIDPEHYQNPDLIFTTEKDQRNISRVSGALPKNLARKSSRPVEPPSDFKISNPADIAEGMQVRHLRFGEGKVLAVEGKNDNKVATIYFKETDSPSKRIMLKFAKLQILN